MLSIASEQIMDFIGGIKYMDNGLGRRRPNQGKHKSVKTRVESGTRARESRPSVECDTRRGRKVDTTA